MARLNAAMFCSPVEVSGLLGVGAKTGQGTSSGGGGWTYTGASEKVVMSMFISEGWLVGTVSGWVGSVGMCPIGIESRGLRGGLGYVPSLPVLFNDATEVIRDRVCLVLDKREAGLDGVSISESQLSL